MGLPTLGVPITLNPGAEVVLVTVTNRITHYFKDHVVIWLVTALLRNLPVNFILE